MDLARENIFSLFNKFFIPTLFGMLSISTVTAIDGIFVGHGIGSDGIAAINICVPPLMIFTGFGLMLGIGSSVISSIALAKGKIKLARLNVSQSLLFGTVITTAAVAVMMLFSRPTAYLLGASDYLLPLVEEYLLWFLPSLIFQIWLVVSLFIVRLDGAPRLAMMCNVIAAVANTFLGWLFIFPFGWGMAGAAFAATLSCGIGGTIAVAYLLCRAGTLRLYPVKIGIRGLHIFFKDILGQCRVGSSALLGEATMAVLMFVGNHVFMQYLGDDGVGAFGICCYYMPFVFMIGNAIAQSAQPIISFNHGLNNGRRVVAAEKTALATALVCGSLVTLMFITLPQTLVGLFLDINNPAAQLAIQGFPYFAAGFVFFVFNLTIIGYFQSVEALKPATFFALLRGFVFLIPCFILLPQLSRTGGIWLAMPTSEMLTLLTVGLYYMAHRNKSCRAAF